MRDVYWLDAWAIATTVSEKVNPATVIIDPAIDYIPREPSAPAPKIRGYSASSSRLVRPSTSMNIKARTALAMSIRTGTNHKLDRKFDQSCFKLFKSSSRSWWPSVFICRARQTSHLLPQRCNLNAQAVDRLCACQFRVVRLGIATNEKSGYCRRHIPKDCEAVRFVAVERDNSLRRP